MSDIFDALVKAQREVDDGRAAADEPRTEPSGEDSGPSAGADIESAADRNGAGRERVRVARWRNWLPSWRASRNGHGDGRPLEGSTQGGAIGEQFRVLRTRIEIEKPGTIMITSALDQEGKTLCATNLAIALSKRIGPGVILVDADLRHSSVAANFGIAETPGLADCLMGEAQWRDCLVATQHYGLRVLPAGSRTSMACELLGSERMHELTAEIKAELPYHHIVFDTPPILLTADPLVVSRYMDHVVLVVRAGMTPRAAVLKAVEALGPDRVMGIVLNDATQNISHYYHYGRKYGYHDTAGS
jgi:protein-tyrosine kinase